MASKDANGLERWRGAVSAQLEAIAHRIDELRAEVQSVSGRFEAALHKHVDDDTKEFKQHENRMNAMETRAAANGAKVAAIVGVLAAIFGGVVQAMARSFFDTP